MWTPVKISILSSLWRVKISIYLRQLLCLPLFNVKRAKRCWCTIQTSSDHPRKSSLIGKIIGNVHTTFWQYSVNFLKSSENCFVISAVYIINKIVHGCLQIGNSSSPAQLDISLNNKTNSKKLLATNSSWRGISVVLKVKNVQLFCVIICHVMSSVFPEFFLICELLNRLRKQIPKGRVAEFNQSCFCTTRIRETKNNKKHQVVQEQAFFGFDV